LEMQDGAGALPLGAQRAVGWVMERSAHEAAPAQPHHAAWPTRHPQLAQCFNPRAPRGARQPYAISLSAYGPTFKSREPTFKPPLTTGPTGPNPP
jgi:hypothetical protein